MRTKYALEITAVACWVTIRASGAQWPCADNFNDGIRDTNLWADVTVISGGDTADLMETNSRVRFVRNNTNDIAIAFRPLCAAIPVASDWEAQVRVHTPSVASNGESVVLGLGLTADAPVQDGKGPIGVILSNSDGGHMYMIFFDLAAYPSNTFKSKIHDKETGTDGWVRLRWRAAVSNLYADYTANTNLGWRALGGPRRNPLQVEPTNHFVLGLFGGSQYRAVPADDDFWLDDFISVTNPLFGVSGAVITNFVRESSNDAVRVWFSSRFGTVYDLELVTSLTTTNAWTYDDQPTLGDVGPLGLAWSSSATGACGFVRVTSVGVDAVITNFAAAENLLDTPERIRQYMQGHIYYADPESYHNYETNDWAVAPTNVFAKGTGACTDQSALFAYLLNHHDDAAHSRFDVHMVRFGWDWVRGEGQLPNHCITVYKDTDGEYRFFSDGSVYGPLDPTNAVMDALLNYEKQIFDFTTLYTNRVFEAPTNPNSDFIFGPVMEEW